MRTVEANDGESEAAFHMWARGESEALLKDSY